MIKALSHITFVVSDLDRMEQLLVRVFDAEKVYDSGTNTFSLSTERFFRVGGQWIATMQGEPLPVRTYNHVAFKIEPAEFDDYLTRVHSLGLDVREGRSRIDGEGESLYFHDYDNHLFELHTGTLEQRLEAYSKRTGL